MIYVIDKKREFLSTHIYYEIRQEKLRERVYNSFRGITSFRLNGVSWGISYGISNENLIRLCVRL